jgi:hypothetical protein
MCRHSKQPEKIAAGYIRDGIYLNIAIGELPEGIERNEKHVKVKGGRMCWVRKISLLY